DYRMTDVERQVAVALMAAIMGFLLKAIFDLARSLGKSDPVFGNQMNAIIAQTSAFTALVSAFATQISELTAQVTALNARVESAEEDVAALHTLARQHSAGMARVQVGMAELGYREMRGGGPPTR